MKNQFHVRCWEDRGAQGNSAHLCFKHYQGLFLLGLDIWLVLNFGSWSYCRRGEERTALFKQHTKYHVSFTSKFTLKAPHVWCFDRWSFVHPHLSSDILFRCQCHCSPLKPPYQLTDLQRPGRIQRGPPRSTDPPPRRRGFAPRRASRRS